MASKKVENISSAIGALTSLEKANDLSVYGREFQIKLISLLVKDRIFSFDILPIIKMEYFTDPTIKVIFRTISNYVSEYGSLPTIDNIRILITEVGGDMKLFNNVLEKVETISLEDRDFVIKKSRDFCFSKHATIELEKSKLLLNEGNFAEAQAIAADAFKHSGLNQIKSYNLKTDYEKLFDQVTNHHNPVPLPFPTFNDNMQGGPGRGNLVIMVAESNFGKSNALIAISRHANAHKKNVVFFSFEIGGIDMLRRHIAGLNGLRQEEVKNSRNVIMEKLSDPNLGDFILIEERATNARISVIRNHLEYLKSTGFFPDAICVDALNQLKLPVGMRYEGDNQKFEYLAEELRDLAGDYELPLFTVMQTNRSGFGAEVNDIQQIGKAIEPFQVADILITFAQTRQMAAEQKCNTFLIKNRLGKKFILLECHYDPNMCIFTELAVIDDLLLLSPDKKESVKNAALDAVQKLRSGGYDKK